ncbi:hypothetical protein HID58_055332, partial [Brassica napus]
SFLKFIPSNHLSSTKSTHISLKSSDHPSKESGTKGSHHKGFIKWKPWLGMSVQKEAKTKRSSQDVSSATRRPERYPQPDLFSSSTMSLLEKKTILERSRPERLLDTPIRRSRGQSKQSREETKPVHSRDDQELLRGDLKRMSSPQNITDMCNQIFKDLEKDKYRAHDLPQRILTQGIVASRNRLSKS